MQCRVVELHERLIEKKKSESGRSLCLKYFPTFCMEGLTVIGLQTMDSNLGSLSYCADALTA